MVERQDRTAGKIMASNSPLSVIANGSNSFGSDFFKRLVQGKSGNIVCSPLSANIVLAVAAYGARGNTALQMRQTLRLPEEDAKGQSGYDTVIATLNGVKNADLGVAKKILITKAFKEKPECATVTKNTFHPKCEKIEISNSAAVAATNSWCANKTNNHIKDLFAPAKPCPPKAYRQEPREPTCGCDLCKRNVISGKCCREKKKDGTDRNSEEHEPGRLRKA